MLKSGEFKDIGSPHRELTERDRALINSLIANIQKQFIDAVAEGRDLPEEEVRRLADGSIFSGAQAKDLGLVDVLGNFQDAVDLAKEMVGIEGDVTLVYSKKSRLELLDLIFETAARSITQQLQGMRTRLEFRWNGLLDPKVSGSY